MTLRVAVGSFQIMLSDPGYRDGLGTRIADGYALVFYASFGPVGKEELEYIVGWHTQQRFLTFAPQEPALDFKGAAEPDTAPAGPRRVARGRATAEQPEPAVANS